MKKHTVWVAVLALGIWAGCAKKTPANNAASPAMTENHGQERSEQAHDENAERKDAHDEAKADDKAAKDAPATKDATKKDKK